MPMSTRKTEQEIFWEGEFGNEYVTRNQSANLIASNTHLFAKVLARTHGIGSVIEFGANIGNNLKALRHLLPNAELAGIEINSLAAEQLNTWGEAEVFHESVLEFEAARQWDMALIKGVLIHISPDCLPEVYDRLHRTAGRYICIVEYYNPSPVEVSYRGHVNRPFKRDFAGEMLDRFPDLRVVDYGFAWRRDPVFPLDDCSWFLLEKRS